jgi:predicted GIY-YIG superfamily endonuclease
MDNWWVYIVEKKTGLYVGITTNLENRMRQHGQPAPLYVEGRISKTDPKTSRNLLACFEIQSKAIRILEIQRLWQKLKHLPTRGIQQAD